MGLFQGAKGVTTPDWNPLYDNLDANGQNMSNRWADLIKKGIQQKSDPFWQQQMDAARANAQKAQATQQDAFNIAQGIANGGPTAAQGAIQQGTQLQQNALQSGAAGAAGGARGAASALGTGGLASVDAQLQGAANLQGQQASDQINATNMLQGIAQQMRAGQQRDLGMFNQNAFDRAQNNLGWRGLNDQYGLDLGKLMQDEWFGQHGFQQDRAKLADDAWWAKNAIDRANQAGAIGAAEGALGYMGKAIGSDSGGGTPNTPNVPTSQSDDYINSDERVKEEVRQQAYQEGLSDARQGFTGIEDLLKNKDAKRNARQQGGATAQDASLAKAAMLNPNVAPELGRPVAPAQPFPTSTRALLGNLSLPAPGAAPPPPAKPPVDPNSYPPEFKALLASLQRPSTIGQPTPTLQQVMAPQFSGLMNALQAPGAVDPSVDHFYSDERAKVTVKAGEPMAPTAGQLTKDTTKEGKPTEYPKTRMVPIKSMKDPYTGKNDAGLPDMVVTSDERAKTNIRDEADPFLDALARGRASYEYKNPSMEPNPGKGGRSLGVMAQELERVPDVGRQLVDDTPQGKMVNVKSLVSALAAGTGALHDRFGDIEQRVRRLEGGKRRG